MSKERKYTQLVEAAIARHQQGGVLSGDYVRIKKDALSNKIVEGMTDALKMILASYIKNQQIMRVSYIKSGHSEAFSGPVDAPNIPSPVMWADVLTEYAPGMWKDPLTLPIEILERIPLDDFQTFPQYDKNLDYEHGSDPKTDEVRDKQTMSKDKERNLAEPTGKKVKKGKIKNESVEIFESYMKSIVKIEPVE